MMGGETSEDVRSGSVMKDGNLGSVPRYQQHASCHAVLLSPPPVSASDRLMLDKTRLLDV